MGMVYYGNYFTFFEIGRVEYMRARGVAYKQMEREDDSFIVVAEASCRYLRPARYDDLLRIRTRVSEARRRSIRFAYQILREEDGEMLATGETLHIICNRDGRPKSLPEKYRPLFPHRLEAGSELAPKNQTAAPCRLLSPGGSTKLRGMTHRQADQRQRRSGEGLKQK
jgi:acyl-CoA thioester hydrolase